VPIGPTGGWTTYQGFAGSAPLAFPQGRHVVTIAFEGVNRINLDRLVFSNAAPTATATTTVVPTVMDTPPPVAFPTTTATPTVKPELQNATLPALPGTTSAPRDPDNDGRYEDINGNGRIDFSDVTLLFNNLDTVTKTYPTAAFDFNKNGRTDYGDVTVLYGRL
jgi:PKD repeat protein